MKKVKKWEVYCDSCDMGAVMDVESFYSKVHDSQFIIRPSVECDKCHSVCVLTLVEWELEEK